MKITVVFSPIDLQFPSSQYPEIQPLQDMNDLNFAGKGFAHHLASVELDVPQRNWVDGAGILLLLRMFLLERSRLRCSPSTMTTRMTLQFKGSVIPIKKKQQLTCHGSQLRILYGNPTRDYPQPNQPKVQGSSVDSFNKHLAKVQRESKKRIAQQFLGRTFSGKIFEEMPWVVVFVLDGFLVPFLCLFMVVYTIYGWCLLFLSSLNR